MEKTNKTKSTGLNTSQITWVVQDVEKSKMFFQEMFGVKNFMPIGTTRLQDFDGTCYGERVDAQNLVTMTYSGRTFIEIIQPISGKSIFKDCIDNNPTGDIQHIVCSTPIENFENLISEFENKGFKVVSSFDTPIAKIIFLIHEKKLVFLQK